MTLFAALLRTLADAQICFIVVGGAAATAHGAARLSQDLDFVYKRSPENLSSTTQSGYHCFLVRAVAAWIWTR